MNSSIGSSGPHTGLGMVTTENYQVPDRMVGLSKFLEDDLPSYTGIMLLRQWSVAHLADYSWWYHLERACFWKYLVIFKWWGVSFRD